jgi:MerC mercury resistance protein
MNQTGGSPSHARIDLLGMYVSLVCALHCLTVPLLVTVLPLAGAGVALGGSLEVLFIAASVALATGSLCWGFRRHRRWRVLIVLGAALTMIAVGRFLASEPYELVCVVMGAAALAGGHLLNRYLCRTCVVCEDEPARGGS